MEVVSRSLTKRWKSREVAVWGGGGREGGRRCVLPHGVLADSVSLQCQNTIAIPTWTCEKLKYF